MATISDLKKRYPLPEGTTDEVVNRGQIARAFDVSEPTVDKMIADGMPTIEDGRNGRAFKLQLSDCYAWKCARDTDEQQRTARAEDAVKQMRLALLGSPASTEGDDRALSPKQRTEIYEAEFAFMRAAQARGELVKVKDVEDMLEVLLSTCRDGIVALPDRLHRECNLTGRQVENAVAACDDVLREFEAKLRAGLPRASSASATEQRDMATVN